LKILKNLRTASLKSEFTDTYKKCSTKLQNRTVQQRQILAEVQYAMKRYWMVCCSKALLL